MGRATFLVLTAMLGVGQVHAGSLTLSTGDKWPPYTDSAVKSGGLATEIVRRVMTKMGHEVKIDFLPWARAYNMARDNVYAGTFPWYDGADRRRDMLYSQPLFVTENVVFMRRSDQPLPASWQDAPVGVLCNPTGYTLLPAIEKRLEADQIPLVRPPDMNSCFRMLQGGRADYVITEKLVGDYIIRSEKMTPDEFVTLNEPLDSTGLFFLVPKNTTGSQAFIEQFDKALEELERDGSIAEIMKSGG